MITKPRDSTRWRVRRTLREIVRELQEETDPKQWTLHLKEPLIKRGITREIWRLWGVYYGDDEEILDAVHLIKDILETRNLVGALRKQTDPFVTMFNLKNNYGYKDDPSQDARDEQRLDLEMTTTRSRLAEQRRKNLLDGDSTHPGAA